MAAKYILAVVGAIFLVLAVGRMVRDRGEFSPAARTWLIVGGIFCLVSLWLWFNGEG